jgi:hypothetical protein
VKTNLAAERIRLVFVADEISPELRSILEFLNRQMSETEVFAIEVKQYVDDEGERQTIVPQVIGRTEAAKAAKSGRRASGTSTRFHGPRRSLRRRAHLSERVESSRARISVVAVGETRRPQNVRTFGGRTRAEPLA